MHNRPAKTPPPASPPRPPAKPLPAASLPDIPELPALPEDIPDEFRPLMKGQRSAPSARSTPFRGIQLPTLNPNNGNGASAAASARTAAVKPTSVRTTPASAPAVSGRTAAVRPAPLKPASAAGLTKSQTGIAPKPAPARPPSGVAKPPAGLAKPPSGMNGFAAPKPVIMSNDCSAPAPSISARSTPARGVSIITPGSTVPPSASTSRLAISAPAAAPLGSRSSQKLGWVCYRCHCKVDPQSIVNNHAIMVDGRPLCAACVRQEQSGKFRSAAGICAAVVLAVGIVGCLAVFFKMRLGTGNDTQWIEEAQRVLKVAESGNIAEAEQRVGSFMANIETGACKNQDAINVAYKAEDTLKGRVKNLYGELSPKEQELLLFLVAAYPGEGLRERVRALHVDDDNAAAVTMAFGQDAAVDKDRTDVRAFAVALLQRFPKMLSVNVTVQYFSGDKLNDAGTFSLDRANATVNVKGGPQLKVERGAGPNPVSSDGGPVRMINPIAPPTVRAPPQPAKIGPIAPVAPIAPQQAEKNGAVPTQIPSAPGIFDPRKAPAVQR